VQETKDDVHSTAKPGKRQNHRSKRRKTPKKFLSWNKDQRITSPSLKRLSRTQPSKNMEPLVNSSNKGHIRRLSQRSQTKRPTNWITIPTVSTGRNIWRIARNTVRKWARCERAVRNCMDWLLNTIACVKVHTNLSSPIKSDLIMLRKHMRTKKTPISMIRMSQWTSLKVSMMPDMEDSRPILWTNWL